MFLWSAIKDVEYRHAYNEYAVGGVFIAYITCIYFQVCKGYSPVMHVTMIWTLYNYRSRLMNRLLANKGIVWLSQYIFFVYLSHMSLTNNLTRGHVGEDMYWLLVINCFIVGIMLGICYNRTIGVWIKKLL